MTIDATMLRRVLLLDAATGLVTGLMLSLGSSALAAPLGLPAELLLYAGLGLLPVGLFMAWTATRTALPQWSVLLIIIGNVLWAVESLLLFAMPALAPRTVLGAVIVTGQAIIVAGFAALEWRGYRAIRHNLAHG